MKEFDDKKIRKLLEEVREEHKRISELYLIRSDIVEATDKRRTLAGKFEEEIEKLKPAKENAEKAAREAISIIEKLKSHLASIDAAIGRINATGDQDQSNYETFLEITSDDTIEQIENSLKSIRDIHEEIFGQQNNGTSKASEIRQKFDEIKNNHAWLFSKRDGETSRNTKLNQAFEEILKKHSEIFHAQRGKKSKYELITKASEDAERLIAIIDGNPESDKKPLELEIKGRLESLEKVEVRAKSILDLSSEAGLAAGFAVKVKEARRGHIISTTIFATATIGILFLNLFLFNPSDFHNFRFSEFAYKALMNAPLIWLATIANVNMNSFAKSEQIYSHKEALAKSFERYKTEINELAHLGIEDAPALKTKLIDINLDAFKESPANINVEKEIEKRLKSASNKTSTTNEETVQ